METHEDSITLPPVKVRVSLGSEDLTIKVRSLPLIFYHQEKWNRLLISDLLAGCALIL